MIDNMTGEKSDALLYLEDGSVFKGRSFGATGTRVGELVFDTSMTGYQEMLTDPSYRGQLITMTYPIAGSYGVNSMDGESDRIHAFGFIVHDLCEKPSHSDSEKTLDQWLKEQEVPGICGLDTRKITRKIRDEGTLKCLISTEGISISRAREIFAQVQIKGDWMKSAGVAEKQVMDPITTRADAGSAPLNIAVLDFGAKRSSLRPLCERNCRLTLYPYSTAAEEIMAENPDGIFLTSGPGDPEEATEAIEEIRKLVASSDIPMFGICLGHQLLALALGGSTFRMKYGHRGGNHGVFDKNTKRSYVTSQNHGFEVRYDSIILKGMDVTHLNLNDGTVEGMEHRDKLLFSVQFYPDATAGTGDSNYLYDRFIENVESAKATKGSEF